MSSGSVKNATRKGPRNAIGTEPMISHLASWRFGEPSRWCTIAPPDL